MAPILKFSDSLSMVGFSTKHALIGEEYLRFKQRQYWDGDYVLGCCCFKCTEYLFWCNRSPSRSPSISPSSSPSKSPSRSPSSLQSSRSLSSSPSRSISSSPSSSLSIFPSSSPSSSPCSSPSRSPSNSPSARPNFACAPGKNCLRCSAYCDIRRDTVVNNFNSLNVKENNRGYFTLHSFGNFVVEAEFLPGTNKHSKRVSWSTQVNIPERNGMPHFFDTKDYKSNRINKTKVSYESNAEFMTVTVICKKKRSILTPKHFRLDIGVKKVDSYVAKRNRRVHSFLEHESAGTALCFPPRTRWTKQGPKCKKS